MKLAFKTRKLEKSLTDDIKMVKTYGVLAKKINQRIIELKVAEHLGVLSTLPALRLHPHKGKNKGLWSVDIYQNWRILFELDHNPIPKKDDGSVAIMEITNIKIISIEDPH